jgi:syntenin-1
VGLALQAIDKGVFVSCVWRNSPAALAGLRFGDQILQVDETLMAGLSSDAALKVLKKCNPQHLTMVVRDRPLMRTITMRKDSNGILGFKINDGVITNLVKDSSAARNGLTIDQNLIEVNGQNVIGLKDAAMLSIIDAAGDSVTVTIMPTGQFKQLGKNLSSFLKANMDHSVPDF